MAAGWPVSRRAIQMMNYYVYLALARGRSDALLREGEAAHRGEPARWYRQRAGASGASRSPRRRPFRRLRPAWTAWTGRTTWSGRPGRPSRAAGRRVVLRDGSKVVIRQIRRSDAPLLADGFARLGPESRRLRFLRRKDELSAAELRYFTDIDHHDHEALGALDHAAGGGVGVARYVRDASDPQSAEIAVTVVDDWQGRGLGAELLAQLSGRARAEGIRRFTALVSADNAAMTALLRRLCADPLHREYGTVEWEIPLVPAAESSSDRQRAVGGHDGRGQGGGSHQVAVDGGRCAAALCERPHEQGGSAPGVTGHEYAIRAGAEVGAPREVAPRVQPERELLSYAAVVFRAGEAQREKHQIGRDLPLGARLGPPLTRLHPDQVQRPDMAVLVPRQADRGRGEHPHVPVRSRHWDAEAVPVLTAQTGQLAGLLVGGGRPVDLGVDRPRLVRGTFLARQRVDVQLDNRGRALAQRGPQAVRASVAATDDDDVPALRVEGRAATEIALAGPVGQRQVVHGLVDPGQFPARHRQLAPGHGPDRDHHGVISPP